MDTKQQIRDLINAPFECENGKAQPKEMTLRAAPNMRNYIVRIFPDGEIVIFGEAYVKKFFKVIEPAVFSSAEEQIEIISEEMKTEEMLKRKIEDDGGFCP